MSRFSRNRFFRTTFSRVVIWIVAVAVTIGAALQLRRMRDNSAVAAATPPPLQMSVSSVGGNAMTLKQASPPPVKATVSQQSVVQPGPLITRTPDQTTTASQPPHPSPVQPPLQTSVQPPANSTGAALQAKTDATPPVTFAATGGSAVISASPVIGNSIVTGTSPVFSDAAAKVAAGDLLAARQMLNTAFLSGKLSTADEDAAKKQLSQINQTVVFSPKHFPKDPLGGDYLVKSGDRLSSIGTAHNVPYELLLQLNRMSDPKKLRYGQTLKVINGPFNVIITKSKFTMDVYLGAPGGPDSTYITTYAVGLGTDNSTPTGTWSIKNKVTHPVYFPPAGHAGAVMEANDPKNPLGSCWMGLEGTDGQAVGQQSYGIHGTIDPDSIGKQSSMGCIRLKNEDVEVVYKLLMQGKSTVIVKD